MKNRSTSNSSNLSHEHDEEDPLIDHDVNTSVNAAESSQNQLKLRRVQGNDSKSQTRPEKFSRGAPKQPDGVYHLKCGIVVAFVGIFMIVTLICVIIPLSLTSTVNIQVTNYAKIPRVDKLLLAPSDVNPRQLHLTLVSQNHYTFYNAGLLSGCISSMDVSLYYVENSTMTLKLTPDRVSDVVLPIQRNSICIPGRNHRVINIPFRVETLLTEELSAHVENDCSGKETSQHRFRLRFRGVARVSPQIRFFGNPVVRIDHDVTIPCPNSL